MEPRKDHPQGSSKTIVMLRAKKGGLIDGGGGGTNMIAEQGCRGRGGPRDQVEGGNTASVGTSGGC